MAPNERLAKRHLCSQGEGRGTWRVPGWSEGLGAGRRSVPAPGLHAGDGGAGGCARLRVGGSIVRGMVISTVGFLIIGIICSPSFSPAN